MLRTPNLNTILQVGVSGERSNGGNPLPHPADHTALDAGQDSIAFLACEPATVVLCGASYPPVLQVLLSKVALNLFIPQPAFVSNLQMDFQALVTVRSLVPELLLPSTLAKSFHPNLELNSCVNRTLDEHLKATIIKIITGSYIITFINSSVLKTHL